MTAPAPTETGGSRREASESRRSVGELLEHCCCGVGGLFAAGVVVVAFYPLLLAVTRPLHLLSSTAFVFILLLVWVGSWLALELLWEWRAGRLTTG